MSPKTLKWLGAVFFIPGFLVALTKLVDWVEVSFLSDPSGTGLLSMLIGFSLYMIGDLRSN